MVTYVGPMVGLSVTYCQLGSVLWAAQQPRGTRQANKLREERRNVSLQKKKFREGRESVTLEKRKVRGND